MVLPNFLIVGTPKAGTTAIYNYLNQHPEVYFSPQKEPHFFSYIGESRPAWGVQTLENYEKLFEGVTNEKAIGEASTWYLYSKSAAEQIHKYIPNTKIIIILRNPIERAYSSWAFRVQCGWEPIIDFEEALDLEETRIADNCEWDFRYLQTGFYYHQIQRYLELFSKQQIFFCTHNQLKQDSALLLNRIFDFLEVNNSFIPDMKTKHNQTKLPRNKFVNHFMTRNNYVKSLGKTLIPNILRSSLKEMIVAKNTVSKQKISQELKNKLILAYQEDIQKTSEITNLNICHWTK